MAAANQRRRRVWLYGCAASAALALGYGGFLYEAEPDFGQLLSSVNVELRLAGSMPAVDKDGVPVQARAELLAAAGRELARARRQRPDSPLLLEFEGYRASLLGQPRAAAAFYRQAMNAPGCEPAQRDVLAFNEARMLAAAGDHAAAIAALDAAQAFVAEGLQAQCMVERAELRITASQRGTAGAETLLADARALLLQAERRDAPMAWVQAGNAHEAMGDHELAFSAYCKAAAAGPAAWGFAARLKLRLGDVDTARELFERAVEAAPAEMRRLVREDPSAWQALPEAARLAGQATTGLATPGR